MQNLANVIFFFGKEAYMVALNDFLERHVVDITRFLSNINVSVLRAAPFDCSPNSPHRSIGPDEEQDEWLETAYDEYDIIILHRFFDKYADKIGKGLLSSSKPSDQASVGGDPDGRVPGRPFVLL